MTNSNTEIEQLPDFTSSSLTIEKRGPHFTGDLRVWAGAFRYRAKSVNRDLKELKQELTADILSQANWMKAAK